jgi:Ca2+-binding EF-hand superfamily protein
MNELGGGHGENDVAGADAGGGGGGAVDDYEDEDDLSVCACCYSKAYKAQKRRDQKKKRRNALRRRKQEHLFLQQTSSKVHPLDNASTENPSLYDTYNIDAKIRRKFRTEFQKIDKDNSKSISFDEFVGYYQIRENASFVRRLFLSFQHNNQESHAMEEGKKKTEDLVLHFQDFVLGVRNFLVMTKGQVIVKTFEMYDDDGSKSLDIAELKEMVMDIWGQNASTEQSRIGYIIRHMDPDGSGETDMDEWMASCKKNPVLMKPAFNSQRVLREKCFGLKFWIEQQRIAVAKMQEKKKAGK